MHIVEPDLATTLERLMVLVRRLAPTGEMSMTAAATLSTLERSGPLRITELAAGEGVSQPAMTQLGSRLVAAGLVVRERDPQDRRAARLRITDVGVRRLEARRAGRRRRLSRLLDQLAPEQRDALVAAMPALTALAELASNDDQKGSMR